MPLIGPPALSALILPWILLVPNLQTSGDVVIRLVMWLFKLCHRAHLSVGVKKGHDLTRDHSYAHPADVLIAGWDRGRPAALEITGHHHSPLPEQIG